MSSTPRLPGLERPRRFDSPQQEAYLSLWRTYDRLKHVEEALFLRYGLTPQQYNALRLLKAAGPEGLPTLTLAGSLVSRAPDITRMLDRLEERCLIERRRPQGDRRTVQAVLTDAGARLLAALAEEVRDCHRRQLGHLDPEELATLNRLLRKARGPHEPLDSPWR